MNKEVELHFKERLAWMVQQLHRHYRPDYADDGTMLLEPRNPAVSFDGLCTIRACEWPAWLLATEAQRSGAAVEDVAEVYTDMSIAFQDVTGMAWAHVHGKHLSRRVCRPGDRCGECGWSRAQA